MHRCLSNLVADLRMYSDSLPAKLVTTPNCFPHPQMKPAANQPNDTYNFRPLSSGSRCVWSECGIDVSELETTEIPNTIRALRWGNFVFPRPQFDPQIVWEFYSAFVPEVFKESGTVIVRGCRVEITAKLINRYFHTPVISKDLICGLSRQDFFPRLDPGFASVLRWDELNRSRDLLYEELHPEMALWMMFINHNLIPSKPLIKIVLSQDLVQLLFAIKRCLPIDVGRIIHKQIGDANKSLSSLLPFPSLITHLCRVSGVPIGQSLCAPLPDIGRESYNAFAWLKGLPTLVSRKRGREAVPVVKPQHGNVDRPKWVNEITGRLNSLSEMMVGQFNALSTQVTLV